MPVTYASVQDVADRLGRPITSKVETAQVNAWLADVEAEIEARFAREGLNLADQMASGMPSLATIVRVESTAVVRRIQQPAPGRTSSTRSIDDGSVTDRWESGADPWAITDGEWDLLLPRVLPDAFSTPMRYTPGWCEGPMSPWGRP